MPVESSGRYRVAPSSGSDGLVGDRVRTAGQNPEAAHRREGRAGGTVEGVVSCGCWTELRLTCAKDTHSRQRRLYRVKMFHPRIFDVI